MPKITTKSVKLIKENNEYYLDCVFIAEDDHYIREVRMPRALLPIKWDGNVEQCDSMPGVRLVVEKDGRLTYRNYPTDRRADIGYGKTELYKGDVGEFLPVEYKESVISEKVHEMTLDELERELGYKIKIVNEH